MTRSVVIHRQADQDIVEAAEWIAGDSPDQAKAYRDAVMRTIRRLASHPGLGAPYSTLHPAVVGLRRFPVSGFRSYLVLYRYDDTQIVIFRVVHGARDLPALLEEARPDA